jgi:hypothetical protein
MLGRQDQFEILSKKIANLMEKSETNAEALDPKLLFGTHGSLPCSVACGQVIKAFREQQLRRWGHRSCISGQTTDLTLRRFWPDWELNEWNCAVVTKAENNSIAHSKDWISKFDPRIVDLMEGHRSCEELITHERGLGRETHVWQ